MTIKLDSLVWCAAMLPTDCPQGYGEIQRAFAIQNPDPQARCVSCLMRRVSPAIPTAPGYYLTRPS